MKCNGSYEIRIQKGNFIGRYEFDTSLKIYRPDRMGWDIAPSFVDPITSIPPRKEDFARYFTEFDALESQSEPRKDEMFRALRDMMC